MDKKCSCDSHCNAGDASPRLWICPIHGKTGFMFPVGFLEKVLQDHPELDWDTVWDRSMGVLEFCTVTLMTHKNKLFYCEDRWQEVLSKYWAIYAAKGIEGCALIPSKPELILKEFKSSFVNEEDSEETKKFLKICSVISASVITTLLIIVVIELGKNVL